MSIKECISSLAAQYFAIYSNQAVNTQKHKNRVIESFVSSLPDDIEKIQYTDIRKWQDNLNPDLSVNTINTKLFTLRQFLLMINKYGIETDFPILVKYDHSYMPYIFAEDEIHRLISVADINTSKSWKASTKTFCLLAFCGLREKEALCIEIHEYDKENGVLVMKHTKGMKERYVPLHNTLAEQFEHYLERIQFLFPNTIYAFPDDSGNSHITKGEFVYEFEKIKKSAGLSIEHNHNERTNNVHCLRHSFTVHSYSAIQNEESDMLPVLSAYLGHNGILETETYLKFSYRMQPEAGNKFEEYSNDILEGLTL